jgi:hypothetical protein
MAMARTYAVTRSANVALRFNRGGSEPTFQMFVDGNGNGVRNADIASQVDLPLDQPVKLSDLFSDVRIATGDGSQLALRVVGATGRTRLLRYEAESGEWADSF